mgnify:CR=1 FL=1
MQGDDRGLPVGIIPEQGQIASEMIAGLRRRFPPRGAHPLRRDPHARTPPRAARQNRTTEEAAGIEDAPGSTTSCHERGGEGPAPEGAEAHSSRIAGDAQGSNATDQPVTVDSAAHYASAR